MKEYHFIGLVVKASALRAADLGFDSHLHLDFSWLSHTIDLETGARVATLPDAASAGTGWPGVSRMWLDEIENLICCF